MALTYKAIATVTVGSGGAANIEFTSIPSTYTDLVLKCSLRCSTTQDAGYIYLNGSSSSYTLRTLYGDGVNALTESRTDNYFTAQMVPSGDTASTFNNAEFYLPNYAGSANKSFSSDSVNENNGTYAQIRLRAHLWSNTSAVTSIKIAPYTGNYAQYSTATLYGIKNS
jgi:hypothetical protein